MESLLGCLLMIFFFASPILGIVCLVNGETFFGIILLLVGVFIYFPASNARDEKRAKSAPKPETKAIQKPESPKSTSEHVKPVGKLCRHCGAKLEDDDIYCVECGNKVS